MNELALHIEVLLLENDCVIVPGLGGFVAHYTPASRVAEENLFLAPTRIIGFNPQLKMNDGLLAQSFAAVYGTNFPDATKIVECKVQELLTRLHEDGKVDLPNVGELRYSIRDTYDFIPYDHKIATPYLYGFDSFEMSELPVLKKVEAEKKIIPMAPVANADADKWRRGIRPIRFNPSYLVNAVAMIAIVALFFFLSTPIANTEVTEENYAQLLPQELFEKIEKQSLAATPIAAKPKAESPQKVEKKKEAKKEAKKETTASSKKTVAPVAVKEVKVKQPTVTPAAQPKQPTVATPTAKRYHIIVASVGTERDARAMADQLKGKGHTDSKAIIGDGKMRVCIQSFDTEAAAYKELNRLRQNEAYKNAWVLKK